MINHISECQGLPANPGSLTTAPHNNLNHGLPKSWDHGAYAYGVVRPSGVGNMEGQDGDNRRATIPSLRKSSLPDF